MSSRNTQWSNLQQTGEGAWLYNNENIDYDQDLSVLESLSVEYNSLGGITIWTNLDLI